ncbi:MAG: L-threonylcarbamoyladenylate synthase [Thermogemmata sp.]|nr:L-threonylcarbamoyladenylate synthase [Thermogemmata sp.]
MAHVWRVDPLQPDPRWLEAAAQLLRQGKLVVFPTETVYGLGANAWDETAVQRIFAVKGRPATNPLIVHIASREQVTEVVVDWPAVAARLAQRFWPGPLTLVLPKHARIPPVVTAGGPTVAVRCPAHPVAQALLQQAGVPVAAPSANRSTEISPTRAEHVLPSLGQLVDAIIDAGPCPGGVESTVVDLTVDPPRLLRPGLITVPMLEEVIGPIGIETSVPALSTPTRSPGLLPRHYAPRTPLRLVSLEQLAAEQQRLTAEGYRCGILQLPDDPQRAAALLYAQLHQLDAAGYDLLLAPWPPDTWDWHAIRDRLRRAAHD